jgi:hypothetical protein
MLRSGEPRLFSSYFRSLSVNKIPSSANSMQRKGKKLREVVLETSDMKAGYLQFYGTGS